MISADDLERLKGAVLHQFAMAALHEGVLTEAVSCLTACGMIFSGRCNNEDAPNAVHGVFEVLRDHTRMQDIPSLPIQFHLVAVAIATSQDKENHIPQLPRDKLLEDLFDYPAALSPVPVYVISPDCNATREMTV